MLAKTIKKKLNLFYMNLALNQARKGIGNTGTNPSVGCVIVKDNIVISNACTGLKGRPHAESIAISLAGKKIKNSSLYTTLEPCSNYGKTPPCIDKIISSKIKNVYFALHDPDLKSYKKSFNKLTKFNINVHSGLLKKKVSQFYKSYTKFKKKETPYVLTKIATSSDFFLKNKKNWITNRFSRIRGHYLRQSCDAIITTAKTIIEDDPLLNCRVQGLEKFSPTKFIIDRNLLTPINSKIVKTAKINKTYIFYNKILNIKLRKLKKKNIKLIYHKVEKNKYFDLKKILIKIKRLGYSRIMLEGGLTINNNFLNKKLIDEVYLFISNKSIGKKGTINLKKLIITIKNNSKNSYIDNINLQNDKLKIYEII